MPQTYNTVMGFLYGASAVRINIERAFKETTTQTNNLFNINNIGAFMSDASSIFAEHTPQGNAAPTCEDLTTDWKKIMNAMQS